MRFTKLIPGVTLVAATLLSGCGDATGSNTVTMTQAEVGEVVVEIFSALAGGGVASRTANVNANGIMLSRVAVPSLNASNLLSSISATVNCTPTGTVGVSGTFTDAATSTFDITETFSACTTAHFVLSGSLVYSGTVTASSGTITVKGTIDVTGSKSGTCVIDWTITESGQSATSSGTICGLDASGTAA
jgi:hypothetical protein